MLLNPESRYDFESRILIVSLFASAIICGAILIVVTSFNFSNSVFGVVLAATVLTAATLVMVIDGKYIRFIKEVSVFGFPLISAYIWFFANGVYGHVPALIMVNSFISLLIYSKRRYLVVLYYTAIFFTLISIQILYPDLIQAYPSEDAKFYSILTTYTFVGFLSGVLMIIIRLNYEAEQKILVTNKVELELKNRESNSLVEKLNETNEQKDKLISIVSHDSRMPLKHVEGIVNMLIQGDINTEEFKKLLPDLSKNIQETSSFMDNLLIWVKTQQEGFTIKINGQVDSGIKKAIDLYEYLAKKKNIRVSFENNAVKAIDYDEEICHIMVRNLLQNALKFTPDNGEIIIVLNARANDFTIAIKDNGVGMEQNKIDQILGTSIDDLKISNGLGLQLVKGFVAQAKGTLSIESKPGKGSIFKVTIPLIENPEDISVNFAENTV